FIFFVLFVLFVLSVLSLGRRTVIHCFRAQRLYARTQSASGFRAFGVPKQLRLRRRVAAFAAWLGPPLGRRLGSRLERSNLEFAPCLRARRPLGAAKAWNSGARAGNAEPACAAEAALASAKPGAAG